MSTMEVREPALAAAGTSRRRGNAVMAVYLAELLKLRSQMRVWLITGVVLVAPWLFIFLLKGQDRLPTDALYGRYLKSAGLATPLMVLGFLASWGFPLLTAFISGDLFASEEQQGTIKTIATRSVSRRAIFWGKVATSFTWSIAILVVMAVSSIVAGLVVVGTQPLVSVSGTTIPLGDALMLVIASWGICLVPFLGFACISLLVSVLSKSSVLGVMIPLVIGFAMQLYAFLNGKDLIRHNLLTTPFLAWHGILHVPAFYAPMFYGFAVSAVYGIASLAIAYWVFVRRDITGG